ncbi:MAG: hypothetical protein LC792_15695 [Actinobacteria bacterium]|nr:hypothetical protein [Actinomycetota bacterium]
MDESTGTGLDRRTMLKAAVAAGVVAGTWVAPRIETLGFAPAAAATVCNVTNDEHDDLNSNGSNNSYVSTGHVRCGQSFGNSGGGQDTITFAHPTSNCTSITVGTIPLDCPPSNGSGDVVDPDTSGFAVVFVSSSGTGCGNCQILQATIHSSSGGHRGPPLPGVGNPFNTPYMTLCGTGVRVEPTTCNLGNDARLAVTLRCTGTVAC